MQLVTKDPQETQRVGQLLGQLLQSGDVLLVSGELGAGKTTFIQGLALGIGIQARVTSPTFTIIHEYPGSLPLHHIDAYRLEDAREIAELGLEEYFYGDGITAVEWAERIADWIPSDYLYVRLARVSDEEGQRAITIGARGSRCYAKVLEELRKSCKY